MNDKGEEKKTTSEKPVTLSPLEIHGGNSWITESQTKDRRGEKRSGRRQRRKA